MQTKYRKLYLAIRTALAIPLSVGFLLPLAANAATFTTVGTGTKDWASSETWTSGAGVPNTTSDLAQIFSGTATPITVNYNSGYSVQSVALGTSGSSNNILDIQSGSLTTKSFVNVNSQIGNELKVTGGTLNVGGNLGVARALSLSNGSINVVSPTGTVTVTSTGSATISGGSFTATNYIQTGAGSTTTINGGNFTVNGNYTQTANAGSTTNVKGGSFTVNGTLAQNANLTISNGLSNSVGTLAITGGSTTLTNAADKISVKNDYTNTGFNTGNGFNAKANVSGAGSIVAAEANTQTLIGNKVSDGTTTAATLALGNIHVTDAITSVNGTNTTTQNFQIKNTASTLKIRGALQTTGTTIDPRLSGQGVNDLSASSTSYTANGIAAGGTSGNFDVTFKGNTAGKLDNQTIKLVDNFGQTQNLTITGAAYNLASASVTPLGPTNLGNVRVGGSLSQNVAVTNTAPVTVTLDSPNGYTEKLDAKTGAVTGDATKSGGPITALAAGAGSDTSLQVGLSTSSAGHKSGTVQIELASNGTGTSGLATTTLAPQTVSVNGNVYNTALASKLSDVNFGGVHKDTVVSNTQNISNTATATAGDAFSPGGYTEKLQISLAGSSGDVIVGNANPNPPTVSAALIDAGGSGTVTVGIDSSSVGGKSGSIQVATFSNGDGTSGLAPLSLGTQSITATATVYDYANAAWGRTSGIGGFTQVDNSHWTLDLGNNILQNSAITQVLNVFNTSLSGFADTLNGLSFSEVGAGSDFILNGSNWTAFTQDTWGNLSAGIDTSTLGALSGRLQLVWNGYNPNIGGSEWYGISGVGGQNQTSSIYLDLIGTVISGTIPPSQDLAEPSILWLFSSASVGVWLNSRRKKAETA